MVVVGTRHIAVQCFVLLFIGIVKEHIDKALPRAQIAANGNQFIGVREEFQRLGEKRLSLLFFSTIKKQAHERSTRMTC